MINRSRTVAALAAVTVSAGLLAAAAPANAAANYCGASYRLLKTYKVEDAGYLHVYYSSSTGKNCAVTVGAGEHYGKRDGKSVWIRRTGGTWIKDTGRYQYYAGPVYVKASGHCIDVEGRIEGWNWGGAASVFCD
ncbi:serine/threonine protein kinase [Nonomuraea rhodomycinica]|uniref:Serine/threonine protein kinase n=1 Tax=Nonomuraea rhodomycinica TaxID=1712872 RepID=A0A7Y6IS58_9ACTN|nr:serine/threonine protein kinase [Nonomuraea rhodomycinica]NUW42144.1 serine/threonine protein kinase [Nonomuraea rhodomycinica]